MGSRYGGLLLIGICGLALMGWAVAQPNELSLDRQLVLARNTARLAVEVSLLATPLGLFLSLVWLKTNLPFRRAALTVVLVLLFVPLYVQASAWQAGFGQLGWYTVGRELTASPLLSGWQATVWVHVASATPWAAVIIGIGLTTIPRDSEEAALLETGPVRIIPWIIIPQSATWIAVAAVWVGVMAAAELVVVDLFQVDTYARYLYLNFAQSQPAAGVYSMLVFPSLISFVLIGGALWMAARRAPVGMRELGVAPLRFDLRRTRWWWFSGLLILIALLTIVPVGNLVYQAGYRIDERGEPSWSVAMAFQVLGAGWWEFGDEIRWTFIIGALASTLSLSAAVVAAGLMRSHRWAAVASWLVAAVLVAVPAPLIGMWLIPIMTQTDWLYRLHNETVLSAVIASALRIWPTLLVLCWFAARDIPRDVMDLARLDSTSVWRRFVFVSAPLLWPAWALGWLVGFGLATAELAATSMVLPPGAATVATRVYGLIHSGVREKEAALCLWHAALCIVLVIIGLRLHKLRAEPTLAPNATARL